MDEEIREASWQSGKDTALNGGSPNDCHLARGTIYFDDWMDGFSEHQPKAKPND